MKPCIIGLTGQTGSGKTTVSKVFEQKGMAVINADMVAREVVQKGKPCLLKIKEAFGEDILLSGGELDRKKLGNIVFNHKSKLELLNSIIYPYIIREIEDRIKAFEQSKKNYILLDAPTLFESGADSLCSLIVSVTADTKTRIDRIVKRDGITFDQAVSRINSQHSRDFFIEHSDYVLENNGTIDDFYRQAEITADKIMTNQKFK